MIKFTAHRPWPNGGLLVGLGLSHENLARLAADEPIVIDNDTLIELLGDNLTGLDKVELLIFADKDEEAMTKKLRALGALNDDTTRGARRVPAGARQSESAVSTLS